MTALRRIVVPQSSALDLVAEANHRVANHLCALVLTLQRRIAALDKGSDLIPRAEMVAALQDTAGKLLGVSTLHRRFATYPTDDDVDASEVLVSTLKDIARSGIFDDRLIIGAIDTVPCRLPSGRALMLTLALSEIVINAVKHAHPGGLPVEISLSGSIASDGGVVLEIADDGVGLPEGFVETHAGIGLKLIRSLVEKADCQLELRSDPLGLTFAIRLPPCTIRRGGDDTPHIAADGVGNARADRPG